MDNPTPKISFIPKGSLIREETFLERPRPRSAIGIAAIFIFVISVGSFVGLYLYNNSLNSQIATKLGQIQDIQNVFGTSPQVEKAKNFRSRAEIAQQLLAAHIAVSPIFDFLSANTLTSIMYNKFAFTKENGAYTVTLDGEAPTYAALAYQREVFKGKTAELTSSTISNVSLTTFGTVSFSLVLVFNPAYLSYTKIVGTSAIVSPATNVTTSTPGVSFAPAPSFSAGATGTLPAPAISPSLPSVGTSTGVSASSTDQVGLSTSSPASGQVSSTGEVPVVPPSTAKPSFWSSFWSWFKFW